MGWKKGSLFALVLVLAALLAGCDGTAATPTKTVPVELEYETATVSFTEPRGEEYTTLNGWEAEYDGVTYRFANGISEEDRNGVVNETVAILNSIQDKVGAIPSGYTLCVREDDYRPRVEEGTLYIGLELLGTQEYAVGIAQLVFGNGMPYGLEYALGTNVARELGYPVETVDVALAQALELYDTAPSYLDLSYPCFLEVYAEGETLSKVKTIALGFYEYLLQNGKTDLCTAYSPEKYRACLNDFLGANGKGEYDNSDLDGTAVYNGGNAVRLIWETGDVIFYVEEGYTARFTRDGAEDMANSGYENLRELVADSILQTAYMKEKLRDFEVFSDPVPAVFTRDAEHDGHALAVYMPKEEEIHLFSAANEAFMHEYVHSLLRHHPYDWYQEALCSYYQYAPAGEQITPSWYNEMKQSQNLDPNDPADAEEYWIRQATEEHLGREIDWYSTDDYVYQWSAYLVKIGRPLSRVLDKESGVTQKISFFHYLIGLQGEEDALAAAVDNTPNEVYGKSWTALIQEWKDYMAEEFAWVQDIP